MSTLAGRIAVVTGSTSGIGLGMAQALAKEGVNVVITAREPSNSSAVTSTGPRLMAKSF